MEEIEMSITLQITDEVKAWLTKKGKPNFRNAIQEAGWVCSAHLKQRYETIYKQSGKVSKNGTPHAQVEG